MFKKSNTGDLEGFLDRGTAFTGEMVFEGSLRTDGEFHGSISTGGALIIGETASVHADIKSGEVEIYGSVFGNIDAARQIRICGTGKLRGDVRTPSLVIDEGGTFEGRSRRPEPSGIEEEVAERSTVQADPRTENS